MVQQTPLRTGTDILPVLNHAVAGGAAAATGGPATHDYAGLNTPSVWRTGRPQSAARADVLASHGMDEIEIPACLRKQADRAGAA